ncbi:putative glutamine amidotransferasec [mine drainage metagenome]|uniref:Putative glutamine amidotransferasec n=1 Tax=mine drainage metagenome TaxID=410659 RepID=A0A1J5QFU4_9ZZZZ
MTHRPKIALIGRFTDSASALRYRGIVGARTLLESIWRAGGEPVLLLPATGFGADQWASRLDGLDGVLFPGGGDLDPATYGEIEESEHVYDVDQVQDEQDLSLARHVLTHGIPFLAICRGMHLINVAAGGTLHQHFEPMHRHHVHEVTFEREWSRFGVSGPQLTCSCYHHQAIKDLGEHLEIVARSDDGIAEALILTDSDQGVCVQWHPEDTAEADPSQQGIFDAFVDRCR